MALTIYTQDLDNYPGISKRVTIDVDSVIPTGYEGDEQIILTATTTAYSDNIARTAIADLYLTGLKMGWCKSSGFAGDANKYDLSASACNLKVKLDATVSGTDGSGYYTITLAYGDTPLSGETIAADMETKIRALGDSLETADTGFELAYKTAVVEYNDGKFWIMSGSMSSYYTGSYRSSVKVAPATTNDASVILGFDLAQDSETLAEIIINEVQLSSNYTAGAATMSVNTGLGVSAGDALMITDGSNTDYFTALSGTTDSTINVATLATNSFTGVANSYTTSGTKIQKLREQDPDGQPKSYLTDLDAIARQGIKQLMVQIDYSS